MLSIYDACSLNCECFLLNFHQAINFLSKLLICRIVGKSAVFSIIHIRINVN